MRRFCWFTMIVAAGCGSQSSDGATIAKAPSRAGAVWEADKAADRKSAPATVLAFVNGLHTVVLDGNDVYAGTTRMRVEEDGSGGRKVVLANGLSAQLVAAGDGMELRFSSGERLPLRKQTRTGR